MTPTVLCRSAAFGLLTAAALAAAGPAWAAPSAEAVDAIDAGYAAFGGPASLLGAPAGEAVDAPGGAMRDYQGGAIFYSQATGAHVVYGAILDRYRALGGPGGTLGYPLNDESDTGDGVGRFNDFSARGGAAVYWTPESGPTVVSGRILDAWRSSGGVAGPFGYPTADSALSDGVQTGTFAGPAGTQIQWSTAAGLVTVPAELAATIPGFAPGEGTPMPTPPPTTAASVSATPNPAAPTSSGGHQRWWWIAGVAAAALLVGLLALLARRRRGEAEVIGHQPAAPAVRPPAPRPAGPAPVPPPRPTPEPPRPSPAPAARPAPVTQPAPRVRPVPLAAVAPHARTEPTPPPAGRHSPAAGRTGPPTPPPLPTPPPPPPPPPPLRVVGPPKPAPLRAVPTDGDAAPVINYETHQPAESAIRVTYANNAVGDHEEGPADKSDQGQR